MAKKKESEYVKEVPKAIDPYFDYLDLQLRIMDVNSSTDQDPINYANAIAPQPAFQRGWEKAWKTAGDFLEEISSRDKLVTQNRLMSKNSHMLLPTLYNMYITQINKERQFIEEFGCYVDQSVEPSTGRVIQKFSNMMNIHMPKIYSHWRYNDYETAEKGKFKTYRKRFSEFIKLATRENGNPLITAFRNGDYAELISGKMSMVRSTLIAKDYMKNNEKADLTEAQAYQKFYEDLFRLFFFDETDEELKRIVTNSRLTDAMKKFSRGGKGKEGFNKLFNKFMKDYFESDFIEELSNGKKFNLTAAMVKSAFQEVIDQMGTKADTRFSFREEQIKGVSIITEEGLKKLLLETIRKIIDKTTLGKNKQAKYNELNRLSGGRLIIQDDWRKTNNGLTAKFQVDLRKAKNNSDNKKMMEKIKKSFYEILKFGIERFYMNSSSNKEEALETLEDDYDIIWEILCTTIIKDEKMGVSFDEASPQQILETLSFYGPAQLKGLLGEIATAYAMNSYLGLGTAITGSMRNESGELNYDVVAQIKDLNIGFQVKNYKEQDSVTLYKTSFSMEQKSALKKYMPYDSSDNKSDGSLYRFLMANGMLIENDNMINNNPSLGTKDVRGKLTQGLYRYTNNFLRITDANDIQDRIVTSDIFVIGNEYYPASYLIFLVMKQVIKQTEDDSMSKLFSITGAYPMPQKKVYHRKLRADGKRNPAASGFTRKDLVILERKRVLAKNVINFAGVTINFKLD